MYQARPASGMAAYRPQMSLGQAHSGTVVQAQQPLSEEDKRLVPKKVKLQKAKDCSGSIRAGTNSLFDPEGSC